MFKILHSALESGNLGKKQYLSRGEKTSKNGRCGKLVKLAGKCITNEKRGKRGSQRKTKVRTIFQNEKAGKIKR